MRKIIICFSLLFISGCAYVGLIQKPFEEISRFRQVDNRLYRGGQPKNNGFNTLKSTGIKTIISLRSAKAAEKDKQTAESLGMKFYNLPMSVYNRPEDSQILSFLEIVLNKDNQPVFLYCSNGKDRTGAIVAVYRILVSDWTIKQAYNETRNLGFWPYYGEEPQLKNFIHQLKDKRIYFEKARELRALSN